MEIIFVYKQCLKVKLTVSKDLLNIYLAIGSEASQSPIIILTRNCDTI